MKTEDYTLERAIYWDKGLLVKELVMSEWKDSMFSKAMFTVVESLETTYCRNAPEMAMTEYILRQQCDIRNPFTVYMNVKTKDGKEHIFNVSISELNFVTKDIVDLQRDIVTPTSFSLVWQASKEIKFNEVKSVTAYVEY